MGRKKGIGQDIDRLFSLGPSEFLAARDQQAGKGSAGTLEAVQSTFEAASIDQEAGDQLKRGRLTRELSAASGFGGVTGLDVVAAPRERPRAREKDEPSQSADLEASRREV